VKKVFSFCSEEATLLCRSTPDFTFDKSVYVYEYISHQLGETRPHHFLLYLPLLIAFWPGFPCTGEGSLTYAQNDDQKVGKSKGHPHFPAVILKCPLYKYIGQFLESTAQSFIKIGTFFPAWLAKEDVEVTLYRESVTRLPRVVLWPVTNGQPCLPLDAPIIIFVFRAFLAHMNHYMIYACQVWTMFWSLLLGVCHAYEVAKCIVYENCVPVSCYCSFCPWFRKTVLMIVMWNGMNEMMWHL
jgi:hypothetical protein